MYGFLIYIVTTAIMVFCYPTHATPAPPVVPLLWWIGGLMVCVGGYWFWFFIRADVAAEGNSPFRVMHADLFILSLLASVTLGLIWAFLQSRGGHGASVFFKPAAAFEKRISEANGTHQNLPTLTRDDPAQRERHSMELLRNAPMDMGLGIKREPPHHY